jgi:hypothetical protein
MAESRSRAGADSEISTVLVIQLVLRLWVASSRTYIDPGSGSFIFQAIIGGLLATAVVLRTFWGRITGVFRREPRKPTQP